MSVFIGFQGFRLVSRWFHGFLRFLVGFDGFVKLVSWFFMVFHGFWLVSMVFQVGFMVFGWFHDFSWFLVGFHGFSRFPGKFSLSLMVPGWLNPS